MIQVTVKDVNTLKELLWKELPFVPSKGDLVIIFPPKSEDGFTYEVVRVIFAVQQYAKSIVTILVTPIIEPVKDKDNG